MKPTSKLFFLSLGVWLMSTSCNNQGNEGGDAIKSAPEPVVIPEAKEEVEQLKESPEEPGLSSDKNTVETEFVDDPTPIPVDLPGIITGKGVLMRSSYSTQSAPKATFSQYESVLVIEEYQPNNANEGITKAYVKLYDEYGQHAETLNPGRAVKIIGREGAKFKVSFVSTKRRTLTAKIDRSEIDIISGDSWYRVRRDNGQIGWVFSKFLELDIPGE